MRLGDIPGGHGGGGDRRVGPGHRTAGRGALGTVGEVEPACRLRRTPSASWRRSRGRPADAVRLQVADPPMQDGRGRPRRRRRRRLFSLGETLPLPRWRRRRTLPLCARAVAGGAADAAIHHGALRLFVIFLSLSVSFVFAGVVSALAAALSATVECIRLVSNAPCLPSPRSRDSDGDGHGPIATLMSQLHRFRLC